MRRLPLAIAVSLALMGAAPAWAQTSAPPSSQAQGGVGIGLVQIPVALANNARAHEYIIDNLHPGTTISRKIQITNSTSTTQPVQLYAAAASISGGKFLFGAGRAANDLTSWTTVTPATVSPAAGSKALATVTIAVPPDATSGEHYGVIWAELAPAVPPGGGITARSRVGIRIYLSVGPGGGPPTSFAITALQGRRGANGAPQLAATVHNTGGRAVDLSGSLTLSDGPGGLAAGPFAADLGTTLAPGQSEPVLVPLSPAIPDGPWDAHITLRSGTTQESATARITFPGAAGSAAAAVKTGSGSAASSSVDIVIPIAAVLVVLAGALSFLLLRRRRRIRRLRTP
ncbi:MAG: peptidase [Acidimicrobiales bacterium]